MILEHRVLLNAKRVVLDARFVGRKIADWADFLRWMTIQHPALTERVITGLDEIPGQFWTTDEHKGTISCLYLDRDIIVVWTLVDD